MWVNFFQKKKWFKKSNFVFEKKLKNWFFLQKNSKNEQLFFSNIMTQRIEPFFQYDSKTGTLFLYDSKN